MRYIWSFARADFLERSRRFSFLALLILSMLAAFFFMPNDTTWQVMAVTPYIFDFTHDPSWLPMRSAWGLGMFLPMLGYYYVCNTLAFDERMGVDQLIRSSTTKTHVYFIGKFLSDCMLLYLAVAVVMICTAFAMITRFPGQWLSMHVFLSPFIFLAAAIPLVSAIAIIFESTCYLRGGTGAIIYFVLYVLIMDKSSHTGAFSQVTPEWIRLIDFTGMSRLYPSLIDDIFSQTGRRIIDFHYFAEPIPYGIKVIFHGITWDLKEVLYSLGMIMISFLLVMAAVPVNKLFRLVRRNTKWKKQQISQDLPPTRFVLGRYTLDKIPLHSNLLGCMAAELKMLLSGFPGYWRFGGIILIIASLVLPLFSVQSVYLMLVFIWFISVFSSMGCREHMNDTLKCINVLPGGDWQILYTYASGLVISFTIITPAAVRMILAGQMESVFVCVCGAVFVPSLAIFLGEYTKTRRAFEVTFILITFAALFGGTPLMYMLAVPEMLSLTRAVTYLISGLLMGILAICKRKNVIKKFS